MRLNIQLSEFKDKSNKQIQEICPLLCKSPEAYKRDTEKASKMDMEHLINTVRAHEMNTNVISEHWANVCKRELMFRWTKELEKQGYGVRMVIREPENVKSDTSDLTSEQILRELKIN